MEDEHSQGGMRGRRLVELFWAITPRQRFVLFLFVRGKSVPDIAAHMDVKERTIRTYMSQIRQKADELEDDGKLETEEGRGRRT